MTKFLMFGILLKYCPRNVAQSYAGTMARPSCVATSWALFTPVLFEVSTIRASSYSDEIKVTLYDFLSIPKHRSGANFVCPATRNE